MRIALVVERFDPSGGGVEQIVWNIADQLVRAGDEVHVVARRAVAMPGVTSHRVDVPTFWQPLRVALFARRAAARLAEIEPDVVHGFGRTVSQDVFHAGGGVHADYMESTYGRVGTQLRRLSPRHAILLHLEAKAYSRPGLVVQCVSDATAEQIVRRFRVPAEQIFVIRCGVDLDRFRPSPDASPDAGARAELGVGPGPRWLFAGSGWRRKGLDTAFRALAGSSNPHTQLAVAGSDAPARWRRRARRLGVSDRVHFLGARSDIERYFAACDGLLFPTRYDAFGLVCLEAAAAAKPVITSRSAGASEVLHDAAVIVDDPEDAAAFSRALDQLDDEAERAKRGAAGRAIAEAHSWAHCAAELSALYREIAGTRSMRS